jgi:hypothetical protein
MLLIAKREDQGWLDQESIKKFPCEELRTIDKLWVDYSKGKFGFSVQKKVWIDCGGVPGEYDHDVYEKFADQVGWARSGSRLSYEELTFLLEGSKHAHLPLPRFRFLYEVRGNLIDPFSFFYESGEDPINHSYSDPYVEVRVIHNLSRAIHVFSRVATCNL